MPPLQSQNGHLAESDPEKASTLNQQFCDNFSSEDTVSIPLLKRKFSNMPNIHITEGGVFKLLTSLKPSKAAGPDGLHPIVLKELAPVISPTLAFIFQNPSTMVLCLMTGATQTSARSLKRATDLLQLIIDLSR